jgi:rhodanese-related sulfurtransferase
MIALPFLLALATAAGPDPAPPVEIAIVPAAAVARVLFQPDLVIVDLNSAEEFAEHHLPGARHVAPGADLAPALPADHGADVVFYCSGPECGVAEAAAREAARLGYRNLFVMEDGIAGWMAAGWPTVTARPERVGGASPGRASPRQLP